MANTAPSGTDKTIIINEDAAYAFADTDFGFSDAEHQLLGVIITDVPGNGTLRLNGVDVLPGDLVNISDLANLVWTPALNANGDGLATLKFKVVDDGGTDGGGEDTDATENTITFNVTPVNDPAVFTTSMSWTRTVQEDGVLEATITFTLVDPDGATDFTVTTAQYGTVTTTFSGTTGTVTYHLNNSLREVQQLNFSISAALTDTFKIVASDGTERLITIGIRGTDGATILGDADDNTLVGTTDREIINGQGGDDIFTGDLGGDQLHGSSGDDLYELGAHVPSLLKEQIGGGIDTITTTISRMIDGLFSTDQVENLILLGSDAIHGTGNDLANTIDGSQNSAANVLTGRAGNDTYVVGAGDTVVEASNGGTDMVRSYVDFTLSNQVEELVLLGAAAINGTGNEGANFLSARLNSAANVLKGLGGNDVYFLGEGDVAVEVAGAGTDHVVASLDHTLGAHLENLELSGTDAIDGTGNALGNRLDGRSNSAANHLAGLDGNDVYLLGAGDTVEEAIGKGEDWVVAGFNYVLGANLENLELSGTAAISGTGNALANDLDGRFNSAKNVLKGLGGNDVYWLGAGDGVIETKSGGNEDWVVVEFNYTLGENVENLQLRGSRDITGRGNDLANELDSRFSTGRNWLIGGGGNDAYFVGEDDVVVEAVNGGTDWIITEIDFRLAAHVERLELRGDDPITGFGNSFANRLDGRFNSNKNQLIGFDGDDVYLVGAGDTVKEYANSGTDWVVASFNYTLGGHLENLELSGTKAISGTGNALNNWLDGRFSSGANTLRGLAGNDVYFLGRGDKLIETANAGIDWAVVLTHYTLSAHVEHLDLNSTVNQNGTGNSLNNDIIGNDKINVIDGKAGDDRLWGWEGNDILIGGIGDDHLTGGKGNDIFRYSSRGDSFGPIVDTIYDFDDPGMGDDRIDVSGLSGPRMSYIHDRAFTQTGQVRILDVAGPDVVVEINLTGSLTADFAVILRGTTLASMSAADFIL